MLMTKITFSDAEHTCCFQLSSSSTKKLFLLDTLPSSVSMRPLRLMKSCHASRASLEYWFRSLTISLRCLIETFVIRGFLTVPPNTALMPVFLPCAKVSRYFRYPANELTIFSQTWSITAMMES